MIWRKLCHGVQLWFHWVPAPQSSPQPLYQTLAAPIVVGSSLLSAWGIGWEWVRRSTGANQRRPYRVPYANRELSERQEGWYKRWGGIAFTTYLAKQEHQRSPFHSHILPILSLTPCASTTTTWSHTVNDEWDVKPKASAFCMTCREGFAICSMSLTFFAPFPFITKLNLVIKELSEL